MGHNNFEELGAALDENLSAKKFKVLHKKNVLEINNENLSYKVKFEPSSKQVSLSLILNEEEDKILSFWILDEEKATKKDISDIAQDFIETIAGKSNKYIKLAHKKNKSDESNITGMFFINRMASFFPELKSDIQNEKDRFEEVRVVAFTKDSIVPKINELLSTNKEKDKVNKLFKSLSDLYKNGGMNARSIITMAVLNNIEGEKSIALAKSCVDEELLKAWNAALKYKGKKVKPVKPKKTSSFIAKALNSQQM